MALAPWLADILAAKQLESCALLQVEVSARHGGSFQAPQSWWRWVVLSINEHASRLATSLDGKYGHFDLVAVDFSILALGFALLVGLLDLGRISGAWSCLPSGNIAVRASQVVFVASGWLVAVTSTAILTVSIPLGSALGYGAASTGLMVSSVQVGGLVANLTLHCLVPEKVQTGADFAATRRYVSLSLFLSAISLLGFVLAVCSPLRDSPKLLWNSLLALRFLSGYFGSKAQLVASWLALEMTPKNEVLNLQAASQAARNLGLFAGVTMSSISLIVFQEKLSTRVEALGPWLCAASPIMFQTGAVLLVWLVMVLMVPHRRPTGDYTEMAIESSRAETASNSLDGMEVTQRRQLILLAVAYSFERSFTITAIEGGTTLISQNQYDITAVTTGWIFGLISLGAFCLNAVVAGCSVSDVEGRASFMAAGTFLSVFMSFGIFSWWPWWVIYVTDTVMFTFCNTANGIADGLGTLAASNDSDYTKGKFMQWKMMAMQLGRVVGAPVARGIIDSLGRNAYGSLQLMVTLCGFWGTYKMQRIVRDRCPKAPSK
ncbi:unnamed protein product [Symbiodinium sp. CCMP2592]|nr:unnamed protein product [Symbiodinium sp. CCMP2592]